MIYAVYGTLRKGFGNHRLIADCKHLKTTRIEGYDMYDIGAFPGIKKGKGEITVELYSIDSERIEENVDYLEGYREDNLRNSLYLKEKIEIDNQEVFIYLFNNNIDFNSKVESGDWSKYKNKKQFVNV
jgi:gamma-glutamylcyclotransferase (GGCT)/AIG2-like uncharacterized protein YtfP